MNQTLVDEYDFFLMMDTDTYVRFDQLYRSMRNALEDAYKQKGINGPLSREEIQDRALFYAGWPWNAQIPNYGGPYAYYAGPAIIYRYKFIFFYLVNNYSTFFFFSVPFWQRCTVSARTNCPH